MAIGGTGLHWRSLAPTFSTPVTVLVTRNTYCSCQVRITAVKCEPGQQRGAAAAAAGGWRGDRDAGEGCVGVGGDRPGAGGAGSVGEW